MPSDPAAPHPLQELVGRYDADVADFTAGRARVRLDVRDGETWDAVIGRRRATLERANGSAPDACLAADERTWAQIADDVRGGHGRVPGREAHDPPQPARTASASSRPPAG